ncbi:MAG: M23 family metallopeptidase [Bryobacteraceae bacterium]
MGTRAKQSGKSVLSVFFILLLLVFGAGAGYLWFRSEATKLTILGGFPKMLGQATQVHMLWENPHGVRRISAFVRQGDLKLTPFERREPTLRFDFLGKSLPPGEVQFVLAKDHMPGIKPGRATLTLEVESNDFRGSVSSVSGEIPVALERPRVNAESDPVFLRRGGTGIVAYGVGGDWSETGVRVGSYSFPGLPAKANPNRRIAMFGFPADVPKGTEPIIYARNAAGEEATATFRHHITLGAGRDRAINVGDGFVERVAAELDPSGSGPPVDRYARINSETRRANDMALAAFAKQTDPRRQWSDAFLMLPKAKAEAQYGDHRTYLYKGRNLGREWHLGVDLASTRNAVLPAANGGKVLHAGPLGIYGNCVVIDHGIGVQTVYGHLSQIDVHVSDKVTRGQPIGKTGSTGLAGGDHVHISMMLDGIFVDPVEWSFQKWIDKTMMPMLQLVE